MMKAIAHIATKGKYFFILLALLIGGASIYLAQSLTVNNDIVSFLNPDDPDVQLFTRLGDKFGSNYLNMVVISTDNGVFDYENLSSIQKMTKKIESLQDVDQVISLTNILDVKKIEGGLEVNDLIPDGNIPKDKKELERLQKYVLSKDMYRNKTVSENGNTTVLIARLKGNGNKERASRDIEEIAKGITKENPHIKVDFGGLPASMYHANKMMTRDLSLLIPFVAFLIILTLWLSFRSIRGVILPLSTVILSTLFAVGLMSLLHVPLTMLSSILPVVLLSTGTAYGIHLLNADREHHLQGYLNPATRMEMSMEKVGMAIILSALTTVFGFGSLISAELIPIRQFGIFVAAGIVFALLLTLFLLPGLIELWPGSKKPLKIKNAPKEGEQSAGVLYRFLLATSEVVFRRNKAILVVSVTIMLVAIAGIPLIKQEVSFSEYFPPTHTVRVAQDILEKQFGGADPIVIDFKIADGKHNVKHPAVLRTMQRLEKKFRAVEHIKNPQGVEGLMMEMNEIMNGRRITPATVDGVENLWLFIDGKKELRQMVGDKKQEAILQALSDSGNTKIMVSLAKTVDKLLKDVPTSWSGIDRTKLDNTQKDKLLSVLWPYVYEELVADLKYAGISLNDSKGLFEQIKQIVLADEPPSSFWKKEITSALRTYLASDTAEIEYSKDSQQKIVSLLSEMPTWNASKAKESIVANTPKDVLEDDPEAVDALIESLDALWKDTRKKARVEAMMAQVEARLSSSLSKVDPVITERVRGDMWELVEDQSWVPAESYASITGHPAPADETVKMEILHSGLVKILANIEERLFASQLESLGLALLLVFLLLAAQLRSITGGLLAMIPIVFTIVVNFGIMGFLGISLDHATMMIASISIGIGIDYTIHIISRFKKEYIKSGGDVHEALRHTLSTSGRAVLVNTIAVAMGFFVLTFSKFEPTRRFGYLTTMTMLISAIAAISIFPAAVLATKARFMMRLNASTNGKALDEDVNKTVD